MTKTRKQFSKTGLTLAILLAAFDGEGRAQVWIQQQCAINCVNTFNTSFNACMRSTTPSTCVQTAVTALLSSTGSYIGINERFPDVCPSNSTGTANTAKIDQQCAINCVDQFNASFTACKGILGCIAPLDGTLSTCVAKDISANTICQVPSP